MGRVRANPIAKDTTKTCIKPKPGTKVVKEKVKYIKSELKPAEEIKMGEVVAEPAKKEIVKSQKPMANR
jgi:hypothetical protein